MSADDKPPGRTREKNVGMQDDREVRTQLFAAVADMRDWQHEAAHIRALIDSTKAGATPDTDARVFSLRHSVNDARSKVDAIIVKLPDRLRRHGRVVDIVGALERLEALIAALDATPRR